MLGSAMKVFRDASKRDPDNVQVLICIDETDDVDRIHNYEYHIAGNLLADWYCRYLRA
jgi:hypothetical protein